MNIFFIMAICSHMVLAAGIKFDQLLLEQRKEHVNIALNVAKGLVKEGKMPPNNSIYRGYGLLKEAFNGKIALPNTIEKLVLCWHTQILKNEAVSHQLWRLPVNKAVLKDTMIRVGMKVVSSHANILFPRPRLGAQDPYEIQNAFFCVNKDCNSAETTMCFIASFLLNMYIEQFVQNHF